MRALVQRVRHASVDVEATAHHAEIGPGLLVLLGVEQGDTDDDATWIAGKLVRLRIFRDDEGRMNRSVQDTDGAILLISQFTLAGDCTKGNRPSFVHAAEPEEGNRLYERVARELHEHGVPTRTGEFGADMQVALVNDGPVTILIERRQPGAHP
jgi:D-tyrosyl-tRNA(Tyr) deacylase